MNESLTTELVRSIRESTYQSAATAQAVTDLTNRFDRLEAKVFGKEGLSDDIDEVQGQMSYAKGYLAAWASLIGIASSSATIALTMLFKKWGWIS